MDISEDVEREIMELNLFSVLSLSKLVLPKMLERKEGHIVVTSSLAGKIGKLQTRFVKIKSRM